MSTIFPKAGIFPETSERRHRTCYSTNQVRIFARCALVLFMCANQLLAWGVRPAEPCDTQVSEGCLRGTVTYRERMALSRSAEVHVALVEVREHKEMAIIAELTISTEGRQVPIPFKLRYPLASIHPDHSYVVRANIVMFGDVWFVTRRPVPVLTQGNPHEVQIVVSRSS